MVCQDFNQIVGFAIGSNGGLTSLPYSPYIVTAEFPETTTPDGRFAFDSSQDNLGALRCVGLHRSGRARRPVTATTSHIITVGG